MRPGATKFLSWLTLNKSMQGKNEIIRICTEKINYFKEKQTVGSQNKKEKMLKCLR
jgi:hypothetical protein